MEKIDAVITYVDGLDEEHYEKISRYSNCLNKKETFNARYVAHNEIELCIHSIIKFGKCINNIYVITDNQNPLDKFDSLLPYHKKIKVIDHKELFFGIENCLPTFNSNSIELMMWKIPNLSRYFIYFNDDFLLLNDIYIEDFFCDGLPILDFASKRHWSRRDKNTFSRFDALKNSHYFVEKILGESITHLPAHFPTIFDQRILKFFYDIGGEEIKKCLMQKFRGGDDLIVAAIHHNYLKQKNEGVANYTSVGGFISGKESYEEAESKLNDAIKNKKYLCLNDVSESIKNGHQKLLDKIEIMLL